VTLPDIIAPMLAGAGPLPSGDGWAFEFKYDGVRAITYVDDGEVRVLSRNGRDVTATYRELGALGDLLGDRSAVVDGEIVALEAGDRPSFAKLAARMHVARPTTVLLRTVPVVYHVFDVLWLDGRSLLDEPYDHRRELLAGLGLDAAAIRTPSHFTDVDATAVLRAAELGGLEGVVAKRRNGVYRPGRRSADSWTKVPLVRTQEVLILGWKAGEGRRAGTIGSLLLGPGDVSPTEGTFSQPLARPGRYRPAVFLTTRPSTPATVRSTNHVLASSRSRVWWQIGSCSPALANSCSRRRRRSGSGSCRSSRPSASRSRSKATKWARCWLAS
jgi:ATP-dependent DNA ligase